MRLAKGHFQAFTEVVMLLTRHRDLTFEMAKREISDRYVGQVFGVFWAIGHPVFMMGLYVFIFAFVFKTKIGGTLEMPLDYTTYLLSGLVVWLGFQESMAKSCTAITSNASLVKQVVFPLEILPVKGVVTALFQQSILMVVLVAYVLISHGSLPWTYLLLPVLIVFQVMAMIGVAYLLSAIGTYFRDIKDFIQLFSSLNNREPMESEIVDNLKDKMDIVTIKKIIEDNKFLSIKINSVNDEFSDINLV